MPRHTFRVVFEKLEQAVKESNLSKQDLSEAIVSQQELEDIDELRRIALHVSEPPHKLYTLT